MATGASSAAPSSNIGAWPVQMLDGIGAGLQSVAVPGLVACLLGRTDIQIRCQRNGGYPWPGA